MKKEMIKFVSENFEAIKAKFLKDELEILNDCFGDDQDELNELTEVLYEQLEVNSAEELLDVINEKTQGVDYDDEDDANKLFDMIKAIKEATN
jgi:hypothetical protein